jgi:hypothetical protein
LASFGGKTLTLVYVRLMHALLFYFYASCVIVLSILLCVYCIIIMALIIILDTEGTPPIELAAAARIYPGVWLPFHKFILQNQSAFVDDIWSVHHLHGLGFNTISKIGFPEVEVRRQFIDWVKFCIMKSQSTGVEFRAPEDNIAELNLLEGWQIRQELGREIVCHYTVEPLGNWAQRDKHHTHHYARYLKDNAMSVFGLPGCNAHVDFVCAKSNPVKAAHGYHCALYDTAEAVMKFEERMGNENFTP